MTDLQTQASAPKINPRIDARLDEYIEAHRSDLAFYSRLVSEEPTRAVRMLMLRDMQLFAVTMKRVAERLPRAKALYEAQPPAIRAKIDNAIAFVNPYRDWFKTDWVDEDYAQGDFGKEERDARYARIYRSGVPRRLEEITKYYGVDRVAVGHTKVSTVGTRYEGALVAVQVYPTKDKTTGKMNMEGVYIDEQGVWHKAKIDGTRKILRDDAGNPIRNGVPTPATSTGEKPQANAEEKLSAKKAT